MEFLSQELTHYPAGVPRPNLGCRVLVQREMSKFLPALQTELFHWLPQVRIKSAQLLCSLSQHEEHNIVQHIPSVLTMMYRACNDEESAVRDNVERAAEMIGYFVPPSVYCPLILPTLDEACTQGHITVLAAILKGGRVDEVAVEMDKIARFLSQPHICQNREAEYQSRLLSIVSTLLKSYPSLLNQQSSSTQQTNCTQQPSTTQQSSDTPAQSVVTQEPLDTQPSNQSDSQALNQEASVTQQLPVSQQSSITQSLFTLLITIRGLSSRPSELDSSHQLLGLLSQSAGFDSQADMFRELSASVLNACVTDVKDWCVSSPWRCVLDAILSYPNIRGGLSPSHMDTVVAIFTQVVQPDNDANLILKMLLLLCQCLDNPNSALASVLNLAPVINRIIQDILSVHLVWRAGRSQEALRTAAVAALRSCLCSMTSGTCYGSDSMSSGPNISGDSTTSQNPECPSSEGHIDSVALVSMTSEQSVSMSPGTLDTILPLLMACLEDGAVKTRMYSVDCVLLLVTRYRLKSNWSGDVFDKLYHIVKNCC
ncbi:dynein assembly factor 5, axonemal-like [Diaphorina citri]|uniref:Dynein assembly factor 5, axonemal-like n=1 Tax=Diaphorina citri TaxID=121845 RepID=A0A1S4EGU7_DIACI|nr:dynein assembly factor 5, axonemal-like [Diaphorina citri]